MKRLILRTKELFIPGALAVLFLAIFYIQAFAQVGVSQKNSLVDSDALSLFDSELKYKQIEEQKELKEKIKKDEENLKERLKNEEERIKKEKKELKERAKKEKSDLILKQKKEREIESKKLRELRAKGVTDKKRIKNKRSKNLTEAERQIQERARVINKTKSRQRGISITSTDDDPLLITDARVYASQSKFLKVEGVQNSYETRIINQTPKIINNALIVWERSIPFTAGTTIAREVRLSKPLVPYEERKIEHSEIDNKREGESYNVRVERIIFEDGTQWKNSKSKK